MRIALFTDTYPPTINGVARTLQRLVAHADASGHEVFLVTPKLEGGVEDHAVYHHRLPGVVFPIYPELKVCRPLDRRGQALLKAFAPEIVHVATEGPIGRSGRRWAQRNEAPLVTSFHTNFPDYLSGYGLGMLKGTVWRTLRRFHAPARVTFAPSTATLRKLEEQGFHGRMRLWPRGVDAELFSPKHRRESVREHLAAGAERLILYVGRLAPEKRIDLLLDAFAKIRDRLGDRVTLALTGDGPMMRRLQERRLEGVRLTGYLTGIDLAEAYAAADILAFPSDTETFGNVALEALASGVPVVAPDKGGVIDTVLPGRTGLRFVPRDADSMAAACLQLLEDEDERQRLAEQARGFAIDKRWSAILDVLFQDYREAGQPGVQTARSRSELVAAKAAR